ncbi:MAG: hypothetical protein JSR48_11545 [Verrucomicrobia bacterium]|nr:hypothetical protein [Verrucomicrobiota bacterium]
MISNLLQLIGHRPSGEFEAGFVQDVHVSRQSPRNPRTERIILIGWLLILVKSFTVIWLVDKYHLAFNANWVIVPTVLAALLCTVVYYLRD